jgi:MFS family permease
MIRNMGKRLRIFHPLRSAPVALLWGGLSLSALGDQIYAIALTWIAVGVFGSNAGYLSALQALVTLIAVLGVGRWTDRWDQRRGMIGADLARAAVLIGVVVAWLVSAGPSATQLVVAIVVLAAGQAVFRPALQTVLPSLVTERDLLPAANGLLDATDRSARLLGPGLVALFAGVLPLVHFLTLDALSFLASAVALGVIGRLHRPASVAEPPPRGSIWQGIVRGCEALAAHPVLRFILAATGVLNGTWYAVYFLCVPLMLAHHGVGLSGYGLVISTYGCSNLAATIVFGSRPTPVRPQFQIFGGNLLGGAAMVLLALGSLLPSNLVLPAFAAAAFLGAIGGPMQDIPVAVLRQTRLRRSDIAAGMRVHMAAASGGILVAMLLVPQAITLFGVTPVVVACGAAYLAIGTGGLVMLAAWVEPERPQVA